MLTVVLAVVVWVSSSVAVLCGLAWLRTRRTQPPPPEEISERRHGRPDLRVLPGAHQRARRAVTEDRSWPW